VRKLCTLDDAGERTLEMAVRRMGFSARAHDRILKVARTIADLDNPRPFRPNIWPRRSIRSLLVPKGDRRVHARRAASWHPAGHEPDSA
jgi:hypothetical protein